MEPRAVILVRSNILNSLLTVEVVLEKDAIAGPDEASIESIWARRHVMAGTAELPAFGPKENLTDSRPGRGLADCRWIHRTRRDV